MQGISPADMKMLSTIIFWAIHYDTVNPNMMMLRFGCNEDFALATFTAMENIGVIQQINNAQWKVVASKIEELPNGLVNVLCANGFTIKDISDAIKGLPKDKKKISSNILAGETHKWNDIKEVPPTPFAPILIRMQDINQVFMESRTEIVYVEDLKIAHWNSEKWVIEGPFPKYDFSPCSDHENVNEDCEVTHWAEVTEEDLDHWKHRYDPSQEYEEFKIDIDDAHEEELYKATILANSLIMREAMAYPEGHENRLRLESVYRYMCDIQCAIDRGGNINNAVGT